MVFFASNQIAISSINFGWENNFINVTGDYNSFISGNTRINMPFSSPKGGQYLFRVKWMDSKDGQILNRRT